MHPRCSLDKAKQTHRREVPRAPHFEQLHYRKEEGERERARATHIYICIDIDIDIDTDTDTDIDI